MTSDPVTRPVTLTCPPPQPHRSTAAMTQSSNRTTWSWKRRRTWRPEETPNGKRHRTPRSQRSVTGRYSQLVGMIGSGCWSEQRLHSLPELTNARQNFQKQIMADKLITQQSWVMGTWAVLCMCVLLLGDRWVSPIPAGCFDRVIQPEGERQWLETFFLPQCTDETGLSS